MKINVNKNNQNLNVQDKGIHETGHSAILSRVLIVKNVGTCMLILHYEPNAGNYMTTAWFLIYKD